MIKPILASVLLLGVSAPDSTSTESEDVPFVPAFIIDQESIPTKMDYDVERAAREYRIRVYNTFRTNRPEYDRRQETGKKALRWWTMSDRSEADGERLIQWFAQAANSSRTDQVRDLPTLPQFVLTGEPTVQASQEAGTTIETQTVPFTPQRPAASSPDYGRGLPPRARRQRGSNEPSGFDSGFEERGPSSDTPAKPGKSGILDGLGRALMHSVPFGGTPAPNVGNAQHRPGFGNGPQFAPEPTTQSVDRNELSAQIAEYNMELSTIKTVLGDNAPMPIERLTKMLQNAEDLSQRHENLQSLLDGSGFSDADQTSTEELMSPEDTYELLRNRIEARRDELEGLPGARDDEDRMNEIRQVNQLLERLETLSSSSSFSTSIQP